ncbi:hypothetical protein ACFLU5_17000 [Bacteroidota bacterium]
MIRLLRIEVIKNWTYPTFWIIVVLYFFILGTGLFNLRDLIDSLNFTISSEGNIDTSLFPILKFPDIWHNIAYLSGYLKLLLGIYIAVSVTNEYSFNTLRQNLMQGMTASEFVASKFITILNLSIPSTLFLFGVGLIIADYSSGEIINVFSGSEYVLAYFASLLFYLTFVVMVGLWIKKTGLTIVLVILYPLILEPMIRWVLPDYLDKFFPFYSLDELIPFPFTKYIGTGGYEQIDLFYFGVVVAWTVAFLGISYFILKRRDI